MNQILLQTLKPYRQHFDTTVDLGCGTGNSTWEISCDLFINNLFALDFSSLLLNQAKEKIYPQPVQFILADLEQPCFEKSSVDLFYANLSLQWCANLLKTFQNLNTALTPNGIIACAIPLAGTFTELKAANSQKNLTTLLKIFKDAKLTLIHQHVSAYTYSFETLTQALKSIKATGASALLKSSGTKHLLNRNLLQKKYAEFSMKLTYRTGFFILEAT